NLVGIRNKHREEILLGKTIGFSNIFVLKNSDERRRVSLKVFSQKSGEIRYQTDVFKPKLHRFLVTTSQVTYQSPVRHTLGKFIATRFYISRIFHGLRYITEKPRIFHQLLFGHCAYNILKRITR